MAYETIRVDVAENIQTIRLHRPEKLNAFTRQMMQDLIDAFAAADADDSVRAVIVAGAGRAFCAGADLSGGAGTFERSEAIRRRPDVHSRGGWRTAAWTIPTWRCATAAAASRSASSSASSR
jgi:enoyl-CoA hydratase/carnithine racemase